MKPKRSIRLITLEPSLLNIPILLGNVTDLAHHPTLIWDYFPLWEERPTSPGFYLSEWKGREGSPLYSIHHSLIISRDTIYLRRARRRRPTSLPLLLLSFPLRLFRRASKHRTKETPNGLREAEGGMRAYVCPLPPPPPG